MLGALLALAAVDCPQLEPSRLAHEAYRAQVAAAESAMRLAEYGDARAWLDATDPARRSFEWRVHDAALAQELAAWPVKAGVRALAVSGDGRAVACGHDDGTLSLHAAATFELLARTQAHAEAITQVRFDRTSARVVTCSYDRKVKVWSAGDLTQVVEFTGHGFPVGGADFSPDGLLVASCAYERPPSTVVGTLHLWRVADGAVVRTMRGGRKPLVGLSFSPDGRRIAAGSWDFCVFAWSVDGGEPLQLAVPDEGIYNAVDGAAWSPDGNLVAGAAKDKTARVWNAATGALVATLRGHTDAVAKVAFSPDGRLLATAAADATLRLWNTADWTERALLRGHADDVVDLAFAPDGARLWSAAKDGTVRVWDAATTWYGAAPMAATHAAYVVRFSPDGHRLASCSYDGRVQLWSADTLEPLASWQAHAADKSCHALDWSPDGRVLFSGSYDGTVRIWDSVTQEERGRLEHDTGLTWLDVSPDGRLVAVVAGKKVIVWRTAERDRVTEFAGHDAAVLAVTFSPDAQLCVSSGRDGKAIVWAAATGVVRCAVTGVGADVAAAVFTPDGAHLVVGGRGGHVALHRASDGTKVRDLVRNRHGFSHLALSPDGARLVLAANTVTLVDVEHGGVVGQFRPHVDHPYHAAFDARGERLATCSTDRSIAVADTRPLRERLAHADATRRRVAAVGASLEDAPTLAALAVAADRTWADAALDPEQRAARIEVLTRRAAALGR